MQSYRYTARDSNGVLARGVLAAASRPDALDRLRRDGLMPVDVKEDSIGQGQRSRWANLIARRWPGIASVVALSALTACLLVRLPQKPSAPPQAHAAPRQTSQLRHQDAAFADTVTHVDGTSDGDPVAPSPPPRMPDIEQPFVRATLPTASEPPGAMASGEPENPELKPEKKEPLFRRETEQMLALYVRPGMVVPPTPLSPDIERDAIASLSEDIVITGDDTPENEQQKELVAWMKEDMRKFLAGGGTAREFFQMMEKRQEEEAELLLEARRILYELAKGGDSTATLEAHRELNEVLNTKGIAPLPLPRQFRIRAK